MTSAGKDWGIMACITGDSLQGPEKYITSDNTFELHNALSLFMNTLMKTENNKGSKSICLCFIHYKNAFFRAITNKLIIFLEEIGIDGRTCVRNKEQQ